MTCSATRWPSVSTAMGTLLPRLRLAPSYPALPSLSGVERRVRLSRMAGGGLAFAAGEVVQKHAQVMHHGLEHAGSEPALGLPVDDPQGGKSLGVQRQGALTLST
jgi:hypothetical protein